ncbi:MAG: MurR/RpiR family transcriptional regulator [Clostridia bacterium]|nr:MurR/RpiR family transcriptional regulator [Clostridia bacterium]
MSKILLDIGVKYPDLNKTEKKIADFIMENPKKILPLYITELASLCSTSNAAIVRFAKKLGYEGYRQFKLAVAGEQDFRPVGENITADDTAFAVFEKICDDIYRSLEKTKKTIDINAFQKCCESIMKAESVYIFGLGNSASVATDACHKLFRLGLNVSAYTDNHMQAIAAAHANEKSVVIGISHSGHSRDIIEAMRTAKNNGVTTVALTNQGKSPIVKVSDIVLNTVSDETDYRVLGLSSRIAQLAIVDAMYSYLVCNLKNAEERIDKTELALKPKKM